jgi:glutamate carboxypeptidase
MRGGLALLIALAQYLSAARPPLKRPVTILLVSDEETGSHSARPHIEREAAQSEIVLVMEPCLPGGAVKTARKGVGYFRITARGVAAHAGADYAKGASAIEEIAHQIQELYRLNNLAQGTTVNVGTIRGGSRSNVVADWAEIEVDLRVSTLDEGERLAKQILGIVARNPSVQLEATGGLNRPPLERSATVIGLFEQAKTLAAELGIELHEGSTGGGSDGCFTAAMGVPTLDGLGPDGDGPHALHEHVLVSSLVPRAALLTHLVLNL